jgi:hypothetical protein
MHLSLYKVMLDGLNNRMDNSIIDDKIRIIASVGIWQAHLSDIDEKGGL